MIGSVNTNGSNRVVQNVEVLAGAREALDALAGNLIKSRSSGTFGVRVTIYEGRLTAVLATQEIRMESAQMRH